MDGIVPILMLLILLCVLVGTILTVALGLLILFYPLKLGRVALFVATLNIVILVVGLLLSLLGTKSIIGTTPLVYVCLFMLSVGIALKFKCRGVIALRNKLKNEEAS